MGIRLWNIHARLKEKKKGNNPNVRHDNRNLTIFKIPH